MKNGQESPTLVINWNHQISIRKHYFKKRQSTEISALPTILTVVSGIISATDTGVIIVQQAIIGAHWFLALVAPIGPITETLAVHQRSAIKTLTRS